MLERVETSYGEMWKHNKLLVYFFFISKEEIKKLGKEWNDNGVYILIGEDQNTEYLDMRAGSGDVKARLLRHYKDPKKKFKHVLLIRRPQGGLEFDSAGIKWVESDIHQILRANSIISGGIVNNLGRRSPKRPNPDTTNLTSGGVADIVFEIVSFLHQKGYHLNVEKSISGDSSYYSSNVATWLRAGILRPGMIYSNYCGNEFVAILGLDGKVTFNRTADYDKMTFSCLSSATKEILTRSGLSNISNISRSGTKMWKIAIDEEFVQIKNIPKYYNF